VQGRGGRRWIKGRMDRKGGRERGEGRKREGWREKVKGRKEAGKGYSPYQS